MTDNCDDCGKDFYDCECHGPALSKIIVPKHYRSKFHDLTVWDFGGWRLRIGRLKITWRVQ